MENHLQGVEGRSSAGLRLGSGLDPIRERGYNPLTLGPAIVLLIVTVALCLSCSNNSRDAGIQRNIEAKAAADPTTMGSKVTITCRDGKVTISGKVNNDAAGKELEKIATEEPGVTDVDDQTSIEDLPPSSVQTKSVPEPSRPRR